MSPSQAKFMDGWGGVRVQHPLPPCPAGLKAVSARVTDAGFSVEMGKQRPRKGRVLWVPETAGTTSEVSSPLGQGRFPCSAARSLSTMPPSLPHCLGWVFPRIQHLGAEIHLIRDMMDPVLTGGLYDFLLTALEVRDGLPAEVEMPWPLGQTSSLAQTPSWG